MALYCRCWLTKNKRGEIGTYLYIWYRSLHCQVHSLIKNNNDVNKKVNEWNDDELNAIRNTITEELKVEGQLRSEVQMSIKRLLDIACYRGPVTVKACRFVVSVQNQQPYKKR